MFMHINLIMLGPKKYTFLENPDDCNSDMCVKLMLTHFLATFDQLETWYGLQPQ
mgnify:CR=1 FL=1